MLPRLYAILDIDLCRDRRLDPAVVLAGFLAGGVRLLQIRDKNSSSAERLALARAVVARARGAGAQVIVNDRVDLAVLSGADGVHVGQDDLGVEDARRIAGPAAIVGLSTHDEAQVDAALASAATYLAVGPIFGTRTKATGYTARGLDLVRYAAGRGKPVVAIGGITLERAPLVIAAGAAAVAVISDLLTGGDPEARTRAFVSRLDAPPTMGTLNRDSQD
ncbi:MAG: thiamine phosphate synthase [Acidobacteriota bacterium]